MNHPTHNSNNSADMKLGSPEKEEDFYRELDKKSLHRSCCTCQTLAIFFIGLLLLTSGTIFYLYWQISHGGDLRFNLTQVTTAKDFQRKITSFTPDASGTYQLVLSSDELNTVLNEGLTVSDFILKDTIVGVNPTEILIYGNLIKPLNAKIVMATTPKVQNGQLVLEVTKITAGNVTLPAFLNQKVQVGLNELLDRKMAPFYNLATVTAVSLQSDAVILSGTAKTNSEPGTNIK